MLAYSKQALLVLLVTASAGMATADDKDTVELSLTTTCDCFQQGNLSSYLGEIFAAAVVEVPRSSVAGKTQEQLRDGLTAKQLLALQDAARATCELQASRNLVQSRNNRVDAGLSPGDRVRVYCSGDINFKAMIPR